jgi:hypothetical protein
VEDFLVSKGIPTSGVEIHVLATAGLRLLEIEAQQSILRSARKCIEESSFSLGEVEIVSGELEGVYSWVDVNYLLEKLSNQQPTVGIVEIGGASTQIAFETKTPFSGGHTITFGQRKHHIFVSTFLGLGRNEARKRMIAVQGGALGGVDNPCYPRGIVVDDQKAGASGLTGAFNQAACIRLYENIFGKFDIEAVRERLESGAVSFAAVGTGNPVGTFWGLLKAWKIDSANPYEIIRKEKADCGKAWSEFEALYGRDAFNKTQCADSIFVASLLYGDNGLRLDSDSVTSYKSINGRTPTWTRGVVILKYLARPL